MANSEISEDRCLEYIIEKLMDNDENLSLKELSFKALWKNVKGKSINDLFLPVTLKYELVHFQRTEFLLLWDELYHNKGFHYDKEELIIFSKRKIVHIEDENLSPSIKKILSENKKYELLKKLARHASKYYKPKCLESVYWLEREENFYNLYTDETLQESEEEDELIPPVFKWYQL